jgi:hypothetical protein
MSVINGPSPDPQKPPPHLCGEDAAIDAKPCECCGELHIRCLVCEAIVRLDEE